MADFTLFCDNYKICAGAVFDRGGQQATEARARARGWHIWEGFSLGQVWSRAVLCERCVGTPRSRLAPAPKVRPGQEPLFEL